MAELAFDEAGWPILLVDVVTKSGNPTHDVAGRFGTRPGKQESAQPPAPLQASGEEQARRLDSVRDAAREFEIFRTQDIKDWLKGKTNRVLSDAEIAAFLVDVRKQQLDDLVDALDQSERGRLRGRRHVRVISPRGYVKKTLGGLEDGELQQVARRLRARGWDDGQISTLSKRLPERRRSVLDGLAE